MTRTIGYIDREYNHGPASQPCGKKPVNISILVENNDCLNDRKDTMRSMPICSFKFVLESKTVDVCGVVNRIKGSAEIEKCHYSHLLTIETSKIIISYFE